ncbi:unnamed protein product [Darwinula stevensoni]|uniref:Uncharacterized protein n=1 Tax=Darwinula stevensoni TaxID=69355 RepID=A0A7R9A351_9CRUS|nr:unnamed protein product [Darwinula stevensoni]CAG0880590.1 unnamed protein product [Darwinula stevensoni]
MGLRTTGRFPARSVEYHKDECMKFPGQGIRGCRSGRSPNGELGPCLKGILISESDRLPAGIPELNVPPLDPLFIPIIRLNDNTGFDGNFTDIQVTGVGRAVNERNLDLTVDTKTGRLGLRMLIPSMHIVGQYKMTTNFLSFFFPVRPLTLSEGIFEAEFDFVRAQGGGTIREVNGRYRVDDIAIDFDLQGRKMEFKSQNGDPFAGIINTVVNDRETGREILQEIKPEISERISALVQRVLNNALREIPA